MFAQSWATHMNEEPQLFINDCVYVCQGFSGYHFQLRKKKNKRVGGILDTRARSSSAGVADKHTALSSGDQTLAASAGSPTVIGPLVA